MWPFKKTNVTKTVLVTRRMIDDRVMNVLEINGRFAVKYPIGQYFFLYKSNGGATGLARSQDGEECIYSPYDGWTAAELREYGFVVKGDQMLREEIMLAKAVMDGDKAAAGALADWVMEHWGTPKNPK